MWRRARRMRARITRPWPRHIRRRRPVPASCSTAMRDAFQHGDPSPATLGSGYAVFEHHQVNRLTHFIKDIMPIFVILMLVFVVYGLCRTAVSVRKQLDGVSRAAHSWLHVDYGKK